jgi:pyrroline-5-carboxylate reductase
MKIGDTFIGFIGFGHMVQSIYSAVATTKLLPCDHVAFVQRDPRKMAEHQKTFKIGAMGLENLVEKSQILVIGVRPVQLESLLKSLSSLDLEGKMILTIVAGVPFQVYQDHLGESVAVIRAMPNIASSVLAGMTVLSSNSKVSADFQSFARIFFAAIGEVMELEEKWMDISCAIAGSGPGFVFQLIEAMAREGEKEGLVYPQALKMAAQTFHGASKLILEGRLPQELITEIATPGGTTEAGFSVMQEMKLRESFQKVVQASCQKSKSFH